MSEADGVRSRSKTSTINFDCVHGLTRLRCKLMLTERCDVKNPNHTYTASINVFSPDFSNFFYFHPIVASRKSMFMEDAKEKLVEYVKTTCKKGLKEHKYRIKPNETKAIDDIIECIGSMTV